jgi:arylsulfatase A-like enzyme/Flp pilus assembly protein TadD
VGRRSKRRSGPSSAASRRFGRAWLLRLGGGLTLAGLVAGLVVAGRAASLPRDPSRSVLLVTIDTLRCDALGVYGNRQGASPTIDRLAREGVLFRNAHAHNVVTLPSHANILSGRLPFEHGVRGNAGFRFPADVDTLAALLRARGFRTGAFVSGFPLDSRFGLARGFEVYDDLFGEVHSASSFVVPERSAAETVAAAARWIARLKDGPFFCWVHLYDPHVPYRPPPPHADRFASAPYLGEVAAADEALGALVAPLSASTHPPLLALTSDHGEGLGDHGETTHGLFAYESTLHVPLILHAPGLLTPRVVGDAVGHVDLLPTILDLLGMQAPSGLSGRSLLRLAIGGAAKPVPTYFEALSGALERGWAPLHGVIGEGRKYVDLPLPELYDLGSDHGEVENLAEARVGEVSRLLGVLRAYRAKDPGVALPREEDAGTRARLEALGYVVVTSAPKAVYGPDDDPKRLVELDRLLQRVIALHRTGQLVEARTLCQELVRRRPEMTISWQQLAMLERRLGRLPEAVAAARQAFDRHPEDEGAAVLLAGYLSEAGQARQAVEVLAPFSRSKTASLDVVVISSAAQARLGQVDLARTGFERALKLDPSNAMTHVQLATLWLGQGLTDQARVSLETAITLDDRLALAHHTLGLVALTKGDLVEAERRFRRAVELEPGEHDALLQLGTLLARAERDGEARQYLERFLDGAPRPLYDAQIARVRAWLGQESAHTPAPARAAPKPMATAGR